MTERFEIIPGPARISRVEQECLRFARRRSLIAGATALVPPGLDVAVDLAIVRSMLEGINERFGLAHWQLERLAPERRAAAYRQLQAAGTMLIGRALSTQAVLALLRGTAARSGAKSASKLVPIAGQAVAAAAGYALAMYIARQHIRECTAIARVLGTAARETEAERENG